MTSVGNDIVDLRDPDADSATLSPRFDARVFSPAELRSLAACRDRTRRRWRLWAAKEATYKAAVKLVPGTVFSPVRFEVDLREGAETGTCSCDAGRFRVTCVEDDDAVHAVATRAEDGATVLAGVSRLSQVPDPEAASRAARSLALEALAVRLGRKSEALEIRRRGRVPELWLAGRRASADLSLSHHGGVVAFACVLAEATR